MRLFIAIELPDDIKKSLAKLRVDIPGARWVAQDQIHLTLAFLGEVAETSLALLSNKLSQIQASEFKLCFAGTGCFPDRRRPRVLWVSLKPEPCLNVLATKIHAAVLSSGIPQEKRPFFAHITLARLKLPAFRESSAFLVQTLTGSIPPVLVREFILFQSCLTPQGALHSPLKNFQFVR